MKDDIPTRAAKPRKSPALLLADSQGRCTRVNSRWAEMTGSQSGDSNDESWMDFAHPEDRERLRGAWLRCVCNRTEVSVELRLRHYPERRVELHAAPVPDEQGVAAGFAVILDEREPERNEAEVLHARKMEAVGRLACGLAHEFANLLTLISGYSEILLGKIHSADPLRPEVEEIRKAASRGSVLTSQLLAFSRRHALQPQVLDLNALVLETQKMLRRVIGEHIDIAISLGADLGSVRADPGQIEQVILNLAINARDAMPGGGSISIRTANVTLDGEHERTHHDLPAGSYVMLQFHDTGHGMDGETMVHLFEPFFTTKEKGKGTGLGLATVHSIIKQGGGEISVQSEPGKGTTFTIYLPRVQVATQPSPAAPNGVRATGTGDETILLVEDEDGVRRLLKHVLANCGYTVLDAANGPEALALFQQLRQPVHLLLTDIVMPRMSGRELAKRLLGLHPGLKVIYMSGYTDQALIGIGTPGDGAVFLQKPLRPEVLAGAVREVLDGPGDRASERAAHVVN